MAASSSLLSDDHQSTVDSTSPFRSVKEAIATYGEQFLARKFTPSSQHRADFVREDFVMLPSESGGPVGGGQGVVDHLSHDEEVGRDSNYDGDRDDPRSYDDDASGGGGGGGSKEDLNGFLSKLNKLEKELQETKFELKLLKEKESETEVAVASLNAQVHKSMSKIARMEATEAANMNKYTSKSAILDRESSGIGSSFNEEGRAKDVNAGKVAVEKRPTLDQVLNLGVCEGYLVNPKKAAKKKPVAPLITDLNCLWKKKSPPVKDGDDLAFLSPSLYSSSSTYLRSM